MISILTFEHHFPSHALSNHVSEFYTCADTFFYYLYSELH